MRRNENRGCGSSLGGEALRSGNLGKALAKSTNDAPTAHVRTRRNRQAAYGYNPQLGTSACTLRTNGDKSKRDNAHGFLGVVRTVRKCHQARRNRLSMTEAIGNLVFAHLLHDKIYEFYRDERRQTGNDRRNKRRNEHLGKHRTEVHAFNARTDNDGAHKAAEQRMRRARRKAHEPREQVPNDCANEARENEFRSNCHRLLIDDAARNGFRHLSRKKCANQVQRTGSNNRSFRLKRSGCDRRSHSVGRVVKAVREVKRERRYNHEPHNDQSCDVHRQLIPPQNPSRASLTT